MPPNCSDYPLIDFDKGISVRISFVQVLANTLVVPDVDVDGYESGMVVDVDTVESEHLNLYDLITFRLNDNFSVKFGNVYRHDELIDIEIGALFALELDGDLAQLNTEQTGQIIHSVLAQKHPCR